LRPAQIVLKTPISTISRTRWTGGVVQAIEHLLCKCKALSSNPSPAKKKKKVQKVHIPFYIGREA
jgi:hypothetical protein